RFLVGLDVERDAPQVAAEREVVSAVAVVRLSAAGEGPRAIETRQPVAETGDRRERQARRAPVRRVLIIAGDAGQPGDVRAIGEVRRRVRRQLRVLPARADGQELADATRPGER